MCSSAGHSAAAPTIEVAASGDGATASEPSLAIAVAALVVGALGLVAGVVAIVLRRRPARA